MNYLESLKQKGYKVDGLSESEKALLSKINRQIQILKGLENDEDYSEEQKEKLKTNLQALKSQFESSIGLVVVVVPDKGSTKLENPEKKSNGLFGFLAVIGVGVLAALFIASGSEPLKEK